MSETRFTWRERHLIREALRIASEDGSLYGAAGTTRAMAKVDAEVVVIEAKLDQLTKEPQP